LKFRLRLEVLGLKSAPSQSREPLWASIQQSNEIIGKNNFYCQNIAIFVSKY